MIADALSTDLYELRMAASYLRRGMTGPATFSLFVRKLPADRGFLVAAGLSDCLDALDDFQFTEDQLDYVEKSAGIDAAAVRLFRDLRFTGDVWAVPEGSVVFAGEPLLEVTAPIAEAQLVETMLLNQVTFQTAVASKAARCRISAGDADLVDFSFRRTQGIEAAIAVAWVSAIVGFTATSNVLAARRLGLRPSGTMAHSFVEAFEDEKAAFRAFADDFPSHPVFLVDTYDTVAGVRSAIDVVRELAITDFGVRLDSGDLAALATATRHMLDEAGFPDAAILASGGLDEYAIERLADQRAPIDTYAVGTKMGVSADAPYLDTAYKLAAYGERPVMKLSPGKVNPPGAKQVFRSASGHADLLALRNECPPSGYKPLLAPVMTAGSRTNEASSHADLLAARTRFQADLAWLKPERRAIRNPVPAGVELTEQLAALQHEVSHAIRKGLRST